ncbi:hypothetical protein pb186bvf_015743 [Paramecium bursaria]
MLKHHSMIPEHILRDHMGLVPKKVKLWNVGKKYFLILLSLYKRFINFKQYSSQEISMFQSQLNINIRETMYRIKLNVQKYYFYLKQQI